MPGRRILIGWGLLGSFFLFTSLTATDTNLTPWAVGLLLSAYLGVLWLAYGGSVEEPFDAAALLACAVPLYAALQLLPIPLPFLGLVSPDRAEVARLYSSLIAPLHFAPITANFSATLEGTMRLFAFAVVFIILRSLVRQSAGARWVVVLPLAAAVLIQSGEGLFQRLTSGGTSNGMGTFFNRDQYSCLLETCLPAMAALAWIGLRKQRRGLLLIGAAALLLGLGAVEMSYSRAGLPSALAGLAGFGLLAIPRQWTLRKRITTAGAVVVALMLIGAALAPTLLLERFAGMTATGMNTGDERLELWRDTLHLIPHYWVTGVGFSAFADPFMQFQTVGRSLAFTFAHNDFLQWFAEFGLPGFLVISALLILVLRDGVRAARSRDGSRTDQLLACASIGGLVAFLAHSLVDFSSYVPANALGVIWLMAIASGLRESEQRGIYRARVIAGVFCIVIAAYAAVMLLTKRLDPAGKLAICEHGLCRDEDLYKTLAQTGVDSPRDQETTTKIASLMLRRAPYRFFSWQQMALVAEARGNIAAADKMMDESVHLAPGNLGALFRYAQYTGDHDDRPRMIRALATIFAVDNFHFYSEAVAAQLDQHHVSAAELLQFKPGNYESSFLLARYARSARFNDAHAVYRYLLNAHGGVPAEVYLSELLKQHRPDLAAQAWAEYRGASDPAYGSTNLLYNGGFELDPERVPLDWQIESSSAAEAHIEPAAAHSGHRGIAITFNGRENVEYSGVSERIYLPPGAYRLSAWIKASRVSTDEGVRIRVYGPGYDARTEAVTGTAGWRQIETQFVVSDASELATVVIYRAPSKRFDNRIAGTVWIDDMIVKVAPAS